QRVAAVSGRHRPEGHIAVFTGRSNAPHATTVSECRPLEGSSVRAVPLHRGFPKAASRRTDVQEVGRSAVLRADLRARSCLPRRRALFQRRRCRRRRRSSKERGSGHIADRRAAARRRTEPGRKCSGKEERKRNWQKKKNRRSRRR
ncbi:unnamed protein product, partial [Ixodes pacificus]